MPIDRSKLLVILCALLLGIPSAGATSLSNETQRAINEAVSKALAESGDQSASIAVVKDGEIAFIKAYGVAKLVPATAASEKMRYQIGSISKQVIAGAILLQVERGKLSLDDTVQHFYPDLTRAKDITIRHLLTHTSGYQNYYVEDYTTLERQRPTTPDEILNLWAGKPLNFEPGTHYQYSNTGFVLLGRIVEKTANQPLFEFLTQNIFSKLGMTSAVDNSTGNWDKADPVGYTRYAFGPSRPAITPARGWTYGAGQLAMTASDLARWDISLINASLLKPASIKALTTEMTLADGTGTRYALALRVSQMANGNRRWRHGGGVPGFRSENVTFPDDKSAIAVLTNGENGAAVRIEQAIENLLLVDRADPEAGSSLAATKTLVQDLQRGTIDRTRLTGSLNAYFSAEAVADFKNYLAPLGDLNEVTEIQRKTTDGMTNRVFKVTTHAKSFLMDMFFLPDGKIQQCLIDESPAS